MSNSIITSNIIFPVWGLYLWPGLNLLVFAGNFVIDSLMLAVIVTILKYPNKFKIWKSSILRIWFIGLISDVIGALLNLALCGLITSHFGVDFNAFLKSPTCQILALPGVITAAFAIYFFNYNFSFRRTALELEQVHRLAFWIAVLTAPYTMLIPTL